MIWSILGWRNFHLRSLFRLKFKFQNFFLSIFLSYSDFYLLILCVEVIVTRDHTHTHTHTHYRWDSTERGIGLSRNRQHSRETNIHAPGRIRTRNPSKQAAADPRLRPRGHWDRRSLLVMEYCLNVSRSK